MNAAAQTVSTQALDVEASLLGTIIMDASVLDSVDEIVRAEDFGEPLHQEIFTALAGARAEGRAINFQFVAGLFGPKWGERIQGTEVTLGDYLSRLMGQAVGAAFAKDQARMVAENAAFRRLSLVASELAEKARLAPISGRPAKIAAEAIAELDTLVAAALPAGMRRVSVGHAAGEAIEASQARKNSGSRIECPWPVAELNKATLGLHAGELIILAARPSMGKTTFGLSCALHIAKHRGTVAFFSLEMVAAALGERAISDLCYDTGEPVPYVDIRAGSYADDAYERIRGAYDRLTEIPLEIEQQSGLSVSQIAARSRSLKAKMDGTDAPLKAIFVDHLGLVAPSGRYAGARHSELGEITTALKALAKELGVPVVLLCQLNRGVEGRENKRPNMSDLRESGRIEEDADTVIFLYREAYYLERAKEADTDKELVRNQKLQEIKNIMEINIAKQRQGPTRVVECFVSMPCNAIRNLDRRYA